MSKEEFKPSSEVKIESFDTLDFIVSAHEVSKAAEKLSEKLKNRSDSRITRIYAKNMSPEEFKALNDDLENFHSLAIDCRNVANKISKSLEDVGDEDSGPQDLES